MPKIRNMRRTIAMTAAALAAACVSLGTAGTAHASEPAVHILLSTANGVGVYAQPSAGAKIGIPDMFRSDHDEVQAECWVAGGEVSGHGNAWYEVDLEWYNAPNGDVYYDTAWVFAPYVDGAEAYTSGELSHC